MTVYRRFVEATVGTMALAIPRVCLPQDVLDSGDTAWMMTCSALVLFMVIPGLALFYAGMVRAKNALSVMMQCFAIVCLTSIIWALYGYSLAFGDDTLGLIGGLEKIFLLNMGRSSLQGSVPEYVMWMFSLTFASLTPALIVGAFAERMRFSALLCFIALWVSIVYVPVCHWVWGGGWLSQFGVIDFAGGTVVHVNAGMAGLMAAIVLGPRRGYSRSPIQPSNLILTLAGAGMLWVGWFGFNAGSVFAANGDAAIAMVNTHLSASAAAIAWMSAEWKSHGKPSALGLASGGVAGLVGITPAAGLVSPMGALAIGAISSLGCYLAVVHLKRRFNYDDSLDVFGVHGIGGIIGALLTGAFAHTYCTSSEHFGQGGF